MTSGQAFDGYDAEDRLTSWTRTGSVGDAPQSQDWTLNLVGNWDDTTGDGVTELRTHNAVHEILTSKVGGGPSLDVEHDVKGNLSYDPNRDQAYSWDFDNRLQTAFIAGSSDRLASYRYDALGRRVAKRV